MMDAAKQKSGVLRFSTFALVGGFAALVNWGSRIGLSTAGLQLTAAIIVAYLIGMTTAYVLSRAFVFEKSGRAVHDEVFRFALVNVAALVQVWAVTVVLQRWGLPAISWSWHPEEVAHAAGVVSPVLTSFFGHRYFTFDRKGTKPEATESSNNKARQ